MKDEFYIVLPSNSSMKYYPDNTTTRYTTHLPQSLTLYGSWSVSLAEIQIPMTILHVPPEGEQNYINFVTNRVTPNTETGVKYKEESVIQMPLTILHLPPEGEKNNFVTNSATSDAETDVDYKEERVCVPPGVYRSVDKLLDAINEISCVAEHLRFECGRNGYVTVERICSSCTNLEHAFYFSPVLNKILGFSHDRGIVVRRDSKYIDQRPAGLINGIPNMLFVYTDICEPYIIGDVHAPLLRVVPTTAADNYNYGSIKIKNFSPPRFIPLLRTSFQTITIDIRDEFGEPIPFEYGTLTVTLHFRRID